MNTRLVAVALAIGLSACATGSRSCRGLKNGTAAASEPTMAPVAQLQCAADLNVAAAQVQLAKRYETGDGVPRDLRRAMSLYEKAATPIPSTTAVYSPPVRLGGQGQMTFLTNPNAGPGSAEAQYRLGRLLLGGRGTAKDPKRGYELIRRAAEQGYAPAIRERNSTGR